MSLMGSRNYNLIILKTGERRENITIKLRAYLPTNPAEKGQMAGAADTYYEDDN